MASVDRARTSLTRAHVAAPLINEAMAHRSGGIKNVAGAAAHGEQAGTGRLRKKERGTGAGAERPMEEAAIPGRRPGENSCRP